MSVAPLERSRRMRFIIGLAGLTNIAVLLIALAIARCWS